MTTRRVGALASALAPERRGAPVEEAAPKQTAAAGAGQRPLAGTKLIDMTTVIAGPYTAGQLADYGMDVVKVENADMVGDSYRNGGTSLRLPSGETVRQPQLPPATRVYTSCCRCSH
jgi:hypothetical protein